MLGRSILTVGFAFRRNIHSAATQLVGFKPGRGSGDSGQSSLFNNERRWKDSDAFQAVGAIDELASLLGECGEKAKKDGLEDVVELLTRLQCCLQDVMAHFATPPESSKRKQNITKIDTEMVDWVHAEIDRFGDQLPPLRQFILSGGGETSTKLQYARSVCRRAERTVVPLIRDQQADSQALKFLNRTSDLLFVLGRYSCMKTGHDELTYLRPKEFICQRWQRKKLTPNPEHMKEVRYDRQLRLWGDHGQSSIESTAVCVLGSSALATEIVKNLVLAGVQRVCLIDDAVVKQPDLGQNFFLTEADLGQPRAECAVVRLKELNPSVQCEHRVVSQKEICDEKHFSFLTSFSVVVAANPAIHEGDYISDLAESLFNSGVPFVYARVCGLLGSIRISTKEHLIIDNHEENPKPDLRLDRPFPALQRLVEESKDVDEMSSEELKHTPYILLYFRALVDYRNTLNDPAAFPSTHADRKNFISCLWNLRRPDDKGSLDSENFDEAKAAVLRSVQRTTIPGPVLDILRDPKSKDHDERHSFWLLCYGLRRFVERYAELPLSGSLPDMTSDTQRYTRLAKIFHEKAQQDAAEVLNYVRGAEKERGISTAVSEAECFQFCKKAAYIRLQRGTSLHGANGLKPLLDEILMLDDSAPSPAVWLLLLNASLRFGLQKLRFPGECQNMPPNMDLDGLKQRVKWIIEENKENPENLLGKIPEGAFEEMLRFANSEPHVISSLIGGITAQEIIKLATRQYVPLDTTFIYDGCTQNSATFKL